MAKEMLISTLAGHECRIAIVDGGLLQELYIERSSSASHVGNIYKGKITNTEPAIQAAFVDFGLGKNGFLHISDVHPQYFPGGSASSSESVGRKKPHRHRPPIQECFKRGQEVLVQMTKEGIGTKGPTLTTYLSIPGRLLVMMPGMSRLGVSRKIEDEETRAKAKAVLSELKLPENMGFILRTAGIGRPKRELQRDLTYLTRLWETVDKKAKAASPPAEIYRESDLVIRTVRDIYNSDIKRILCDDAEDAKKVQQFLKMAVPRGKHTVEVYQGSAGLFNDYGLEREIEKLYARRVELPSGGSLVIDQTEALVAIDVNSGRFREHKDAETTALKTDLEAAREIARQLRIRDLGGVIVIDFIDLRDARNRHKVERELKEAMKPDRAKSKSLKMSQFGILEMTRQRMRPSLRESIYRVCEHCEGDGVIKSEESQTIHIMRSLQRLCNDDHVARIELTVPPEVADHLNNLHRDQLTELEGTTGRRIIVRGLPGLGGNEVQMVCQNARGSTISQSATEGKRAADKKGAIKVDTVVLDELLKTEAAGEDEAPAPLKEKKARRSRRGSKAKGKAKAKASDAEPEAPAEPDTPAEAAEEAPAEAKKSRRRGRRGGKKHKRKTASKDVDTEAAAAAEPAAPEVVEPPEPTPTPTIAEELRPDWPLADWVERDGEETSA